MFHSNTELLIDYWRSLTGGRGAPPRGEIDPACFASLAPRTFVAAREHGEVRFRFAGEQLIDLHGRQLRGEAVVQLWRLVHRRRLAWLIEAALAAGEPLVVAAETWTDEAARIRLEVLFAPLANRLGAVDRCLGLYQLIGGFWPGPIGELALAGPYGVADESPAAHLRLAAVDGRRIA
jgi:hypothetical protein